MPRKNEESTELSARQRAVYDFIVKYCNEKSFPPTVREIGDGVGLASTSNVYAHLQTLQQKGYIHMDAAKQRTITIVRPNAHRASAVNVPVVGAVAAGNPIMAFDDIRDYQPMPAEDLRGANENDVFMLDIEGESMIKVGIFDGDRIVVHRGLAVENGDIAVARVSSVYGDSATVKRVYYEKDFLRLQPENDAMEPIVVPREGAQIIGKVIGLYRKY